ncbi:MAG: peroxiredoxin family protein [Candidatus Korobacteraceae bacterium]
MLFGAKNYNYAAFRRDVAMKDLGSTRSRQTGGPRPGDLAPNFEARTLDGEKFRLSRLRGKSNLVLTFGSATCPFTAASIQRTNSLYEKYADQDVEFLFVYVREAHPGERTPAHRSIEDKIRSAKTFRDQERLEGEVVVDDLTGSMHRKYGGLPNPTFLIDKSGRIAFRCLWTRPRIVDRALQQLLEIQEERGVDHAIVLGGEDVSVPMLSGFLHTHRALERGGMDSIRNFRSQMGRGGHARELASRVMQPATLHPAGALTAILLTGGVLAGGLLLGRRLRRERLDSLRRPYSYQTRGSAEGEYAVGI